MHKLTKMLFVGMLFAVLALPSIARAADGRETSPAEEGYVPSAVPQEETHDNSELGILTINSSAIGEKRETWTSLTDLFDVSILTAESARMREQALEFFMESRVARVDSLFETTDIEKSDEDSVAQTALALGLFLKSKDEILYQPAGEGLLSLGVLSYILSGVALALLGVGSFFAATAWHNRKAQKKEG